MKRGYIICFDQDIVLKWAVIRSTETANGFAARISAVRQFGKYLAMIGEDAYIIPDGFRGRGHAVDALYFFRGNAAAVPGLY